MSLVQLRETGACELDLPEVLVDPYLSGHHMLRIQTVSLSIPCVVPHAGVNAKTRLERGPVRLDASTTGRGTLEPALRGERYVPFEGAGVISRWRIELPQDLQPFDYSTIADVNLHVRYATRDGGDSSHDTAPVVVSAVLADVAGSKVTRLVSLRQEFPSEWRRFLNPAESEDGQFLSFNLGLDHFDLGPQKRPVHIPSVDVLLFLSDVSDKAVFTLDPARPTALGDYLKDKGLAVEVRPPGTAPVLNAIGSPGVRWPPETLLEGDETLGGPPRAVFNFARDYDGDRGPGLWTLMFTDAGIEAIAPSLRVKVSADGKDHWRLKSHLIVDVVVLFHYTVG